MRIRLPSSLPFVFDTQFGPYVIECKEVSRKALDGTFATDSYCLAARPANGPQRESIVISGFERTSKDIIDAAVFGFKVPSDATVKGNKANDIIEILKRTDGVEVL